MTQTIFTIHLVVLLDKVENNIRMINKVCDNILF